MAQMLHKMKTYYQLCPELEKQQGSMQKGSDHIIVFALKSSCIKTQWFDVREYVLRYLAFTKLKPALR